MGNLDCQDFLQKKFYNIKYRPTMFFFSFKNILRNFASKLNPRWLLEKGSILQNFLRQDQDVKSWTKFDILALK